MAPFTLEAWQDGLLGVHCASRPWAGDIAAYFTVGDSSSRRIVQISGLGEPIARGEKLPPEPSIALPEGLAKNLMDELWRAGVRPSEASIGNDAQRFHLEDMRALLFSKLGVERPR